ncbi:CopG family ribbon-helix-helix protein [Undibacterium sp. Ji49W]|uniref:CopG family ribbon-helix-helix protein n=1 Tax=Undibacterium sp. Ji49W TaxID=3413040 RepID=UPI003BF1EDF2
MSTTSLKLSEDLKQRAAAVAQDLGMTPHAFMVDAIRRASDAAEKHAEFVAQAKAARKKTLKSGLGFEAEEVHDYLRERIAAANAPVTKKTSEIAAPKAKPWRG